MVWLAIVCLPLFIFVIMGFASAGLFAWFLVAPFILKLLVVLVGAFVIAAGFSFVAGLLVRQVESRSSKKIRGREMLDPEDRRQLWLEEQRLKAEIAKREEMMGRRMKSFERRAFLMEQREGSEGAG
jgi:hypothetical protein